MKQQAFLNPITLAAIALGLISGVIILWQAVFELLPVALTILMFFASIEVARIVHQQQNSFLKQIQKFKNTLAEQEEQEIEKFNKLTDLCQTILPLWQAQIDDVIGQSTDAVHMLTKRFSEIVQSLRDTLQDVDALELDNAGTSITEIMEKSETQLSSLFRAGEHGRGCR